MMEMLLVFGFVVTMVPIHLDAGGGGVGSVLDSPVAVAAAVVVVVVVSLFLGTPGFQLRSLVSSSTRMAVIRNWAAQSTCPRIVRKWRKMLDTGNVSIKTRIGSVPHLRS